VKITNNGASDVPLDGLSVRYYFTNETEGAPVVELDYGAVMGPFQSIGQPAKTCTAYGPKPTANMFCEVTLSDLMPMTPGGSLELQLRVHSPQYQIMTQTNDYSFDPTKTAYAPWDHITVHRMGALLAGVAP
jgi:endoglucanase